LADRVPNDARRDPVGARGLSAPGGIVVFRWWAGFASLGAGLVHLAAVSEHVAEWWLYAVFFLVLGVVQIAWAVQAMEGDSLPVPSLFATVNAAVIGLWLVSRTIGLPVGPEPWTAEAVGAADLLCTALEAVVIVLVVLIVRRPPVQESRGLTRPQRRMVAIGAVGAAVVTVVALAANPPNFLHPPRPHDDHAAQVIPRRGRQPPRVTEVGHASSRPSIVAWNTASARDDTPSFS
jgi:hypothetical protein